MVRKVKRKVEEVNVEDLRDMTNKEVAEALQVFLGIGAILSANGLGIGSNADTGEVILVNEDRAIIELHEMLELSRFSMNDKENQENNLMACCAIEVVNVLADSQDEQLRECMIKDLIDGRK